MNHISRHFTSKDGRIYKSHSWELREGGYRRAALLIGNGLWPASEERRLIEFLLDRGFKIVSIELAYGSAQPPRPTLAGFRQAISAFAEETGPIGLPLYLVASSFSASALLPVATSLPEIAALVMLSPAAVLPPPGLKAPLFFWRTAELPVEAGQLSGTPEDLVELFKGPASHKFRKGDLKQLAAEFAKALKAPLDLPAAAFVGEDDPLAPETARAALKEAGARVYAYPRVKREPPHDRYVDNFFADLGSFLDEVEASKAKASG